MINHFDFISLFSNKVIKDIVNYEIIELTPGVYTTTLFKPNSCIFIINESVFYCLPVLQPVLNDVKFVIYLYAYLDNIQIDNEIRLYIKKHIFQFLLIIYLTLSNKDELYAFVNHMLSSIPLTKGMTRNPSNKNLQFYHMTICSILNTIQLDLYTTLYTQNFESQDLVTISIHTYRDIIYVFSIIYKKLKMLYYNIINYNIQKLGLIPIYWPLSFKFKMHLFTNLKTSTLFFNHINVTIKRQFLYALQNIQTNDILSSDIIVFYFSFIPKIPDQVIEKYQDIKKFTSILYSIPKIQNRKFASTNHLIPKTSLIIILQYITLHLICWQNVWEKMRWPINIHILNNIKIYRKNNITPNFNLLKNILFWPLTDI